MLTKKTPLKKALELGNGCKRCGYCCMHGSGALVGDDKKNIARFLGIEEKELQEKYLEEVERFNTKRLRPRIIKDDKPYGRCVFYGKGGCKINNVKPLECRVGNCGKHGEELSIWFALNYFFNAKDPESIRQYAIYLKTNKTIPGGKLEDIMPDKEELKKILDFKKLR